MNGFKNLNKVEQALRERQLAVGSNTRALRKSWFRLTIAVSERERALVYRDRCLVDVLRTGKHVLWSLANAYQVEVIDASAVRIAEAQRESLQHSALPVVADNVMFVATNISEVALVYQDGVLTEVLPPQTKAAYWRDQADLDVKIIDVEESADVDNNLAWQLAYRNVAGAKDAVVLSEVKDQHIGLLSVDGQFVRLLDAGLHVFWRFNRNVTIKQVDLRLQAMDVQGQEILTKDKVSLRVNLVAAYNVVDALKATQSVTNVQEHIYRELQLGLRAAIGTRRLDELLANKDEINQVVKSTVQESFADMGIWLDNVGVKDIILPGEMKTILNQVVEAEKAAQANVIKRREETAATRSLLNTAKLMDENPVMIRLKELEALERVVEKVGSLNVYQGLDGVLNHLVQLKS